MTNSQDLDMLWCESYRLSAINQGGYTIYADDIPIQKYTSCWYTAQCLVCNSYETWSTENSPEAVRAHFMHCAREHGYVFPEMQVTDTYFPVADKQLQHIIILAMEHKLPLPEYEEHSSCVRQYRQGKEICVIHAGNEHKNWLR